MTAELGFAHSIFHLQLLLTDNRRLGKPQTDEVGVGTWVLVLLYFIFLGGLVVVLGPRDLCRLQAPEPRPQPLTEGFSAGALP